MPYSFTIGIRPIFSISEISLFFRLKGAPHGNCVAFGTLVQLVLERAPKKEFKEVQDFCMEVGLPVTLEEIGITTDEQIRVIAEKSCVEGESIHNMVADVTPDQLYAAIITADALGKEALAR